ncbi:MAG: hypothetical protein ACE5HT_01660 [Gemmatimonadales bacterium]
MTDTSPCADDRVRMMMARKTPAERLHMASGMFATARALVKAGAAGSQTNLRTYTFSRFYARDFSDTERERIIAHLNS